MANSSVLKSQEPDIRFCTDEFCRALLTWYDGNHRRLPWRATFDPYLIWVSEVMLQQTRVDTVLPYYQRFVQRFPGLENLAQADLQEVLKTWEGLGYYARARNFHAACNRVMEKHGGRVPDDPEQFRALPGVGEYIAAAVMSLAFGRPLAVVDGNVKRVLARMLFIHAPVNLSRGHKVFGAAANRLMDKTHPGQFNQAIMELGALVCTPRNPDCAACPVFKFCGAFSNQRVAEFPKRKKAPKRPVKTTAACLVMNNGRILARLRPEKGLLGGMWELPQVELDKGADPMAACENYLKSNLNLKITDLKEVGVIGHGYTHFSLKAHVFACKGKATVIADKVKWIHRARLKDYPFHVAARKMLALALK